jgi:hypothetical protein
MGFTIFRARKQRKQPTDGNAGAQARTGAGNLGYVLPPYEKNVAQD